MGPELRCLVRIGLASSFASIVWKIKLSNTACIVCLIALSRSYEGSDIVLNCFEWLLENPLLGVSAERLATLPLSDS
jgi:hypothetical protein